MIAFISSRFVRSLRVTRSHSVRAKGSRLFASVTLISAAIAMLSSSVSVDVHARPSSKGKQSNVQPETFLRQTNVFSNIEFFYTNRGVLFNSGSQAEGCFWPRGSGNSYIFGEGLWFATKKGY